VRLVSDLRYIRIGNVIFSFVLLEAMNKVKCLLQS